MQPPPGAVESIPHAHEMIAEAVIGRRFEAAVDVLRAHNDWSNALIREALARLEPPA